VSTPFGAGPSPEEIAKAFAYDQRLSNYVAPVPDVPGLETEVEEWRTARDEWREITGQLEDIPGQIRYAQQQDAEALKTAVLAGEVNTGSMTPHFEQLMRDLSAARVRVDGAKERFSAAISRLGHAVESSKADVRTALEQRAKEFADLAAPFARALSAVGQHQEALEHVRRFVEGTHGSDLADWHGRAAQFLPALPTPLKADK
jgi:hypothetical protein